VLFLRAALAKMLGLPTDIPQARARLGCDLRANDHRADFLRAALSQGDDGESVVTPFPVQDSSMMSVLARADALVLRAPHAPAVRQGDRAAYIPLAGALASI